MSDDLRRELQQLTPPDEIDAQRRSWTIVRGAFEDRDRVERDRHRRRPWIIAALVLVALAALAGLGRPVRDALRDDEEQPQRAAPARIALPAGGTLLVDSPRGTWIVQRGGSRHLLRGLREGAWGPAAKSLVVATGRRLSVVTPTGRVRWRLRPNGRVTGAAWSPDGDRLAYLSGTELRVVGGDGKRDKVLRDRVAATPPAWRPTTRHEVAFGTVDGTVALASADTGVTRWRAPVFEPAKQLAWSEDGRRLLALGDRYLRVFDANGKQLWALGLPLGPSAVAFAREGHRFFLVRYQPASGRSELIAMDAEAQRGEQRSLFSAAGGLGPLAVSPNGRWLLLGWLDADQWLFLRLDRLRLRSSSDIAEKFGGALNGRPLRERFPQTVSWCCPASP